MIQVASVLSKIAALDNAYKNGARFLAIPAQSHLETAQWILACFHSPLIAVPLPSKLPSTALTARIKQLPVGEVVFPEQLSEAAPLGVPQKRPEEKIWAVIFTSGSTGESKGVALTGKNLKSAAQMHEKHSGKCGSWLLDLPLYHVGGLSILSRAFFLKSDVVFGEDKFNAAATAAWIASGKVQGLSLVPTTLARLLKESPPFEKLSIILLGGGPTPETLREKAKASGAPIRLTYGMTEHSSQIATEKNSGLEPLPGVEIQIADDGEILIRSEALAAGYFQSGQLRPLPLREGFFPTGDLGELRAGRLLVLGRKSDLIISGGRKIYPLELERELVENKLLKDFAVIGVPDADWGESVAVIYVAEEGFQPEQEKGRLSQRLESFKIPKIWQPVTEIPRNGMGKVDRAAAKALISNRS